MENRRTEEEQAEIQAWAEDLNRKVENGELKPIPGTRVHRGEDAPALTDDDLLAIFEGRPRQEEHQPAKKTWRVRTTQKLDAWAAAGAHEEHLNTSALIRKAVAEYLTLHHLSAQPA
ncbi:hypothetical protein PT282_01250 [Bifidobacterium sp. ESL0763]|uniref:hypothetical protein n=1 Tax=Bifidobacterium sp. ESL0763 TaxID=2983227 RepID=UPI0023F99D7B|nr:hypothetical protein [Bifidobacterium sp. ESL0763]MDF7663309.1 hypothetical protein [Bifidobacterium sp. ESL0763]